MSVDTPVMLLTNLPFGKASAQPGELKSILHTCARDIAFFLLSTNSA